MANSTIRKTFYDFTSANRYVRQLAKKGIEAGIFTAYNWAEQCTHYVVDLV